MAKRKNDWDGIVNNGSSRSRALATTKAHHINASGNGKPTKLTRNEVKEQMALLKTLTNNTVTSRAAFVKWMLDQLHDIDKECGYPTTISAEQYKQMYEREGIAARVVSIYPTESWAVEPEIYEDESPDVTTEFEAAWEQLNKKHGMLEKFFRCDEVSGIAHYGVLLIGNDDGLTQDQPVAGVEEKLKERFERDLSKIKVKRPDPTNPTTQPNDAGDQIDGKFGEEERPSDDPNAIPLDGPDSAVEDEEEEEPEFDNLGNPIKKKKPPIGNADPKKLQRVKQKGAMEPENETMDGEYEEQLGLQPKDLMEPVDPTKPQKSKQPGNINKIKYIVPLDETQASIAEIETDPNNWRCGKPKYYNVTLYNPGDYTGAFAVPTSTSTRVHWTRVVHVPDNCKTNEIFGQPRMKKVFNRLLDIRKLLGGSAESLFKTGFPGYAFEVPPEINDQVELDREGLAKEVDLFMNTLKKYMALQGVSAKVLQGQVADPANHLDVQILAICIALEVPKRVFMGTEEAKLASIEDATAWLNRVKSRQEKQLTPRLIRPTIDLLIAYGALPDVEEYFVDWPDLHTMSDADKASVAAQMMSTIVQYVTSGADTLIPPLEMLTNILQWDREQAISVLQAAEERALELVDQQEAAMEEQRMMQEEQMAQQMEMQSTMVEGLAEGAKVGGVNLPAEVLPKPNNGPPGFGGGGNQPPQLAAAKGKGRPRFGGKGGMPPAFGKKSGPRASGMPLPTPSRNQLIANVICPTCGGTNVTEDSSGRKTVCMTCAGNGWVTANIFCATGQGGGVDPTCTKDGGGSGGVSQVGGPNDAVAQKIVTEPTTPPPPPKDAAYTPAPDADHDGDGVADGARVGVHARSIPDQIPRLPYLTAAERHAEQEFAQAYEDDPDGVANNFREATIAAAKGGPPAFETDAAKQLYSAWRGDGMSVEERAQVRATLNTPLHQTANAIAKRAFVQHLDTLSPGDEIMVTNGGCGAGKGYALKPESGITPAREMLQRSSVIWDSAGDQNSTENPWIQEEAEKRGLKVNYLYVHADPVDRWTNEKYGVVQRANHPENGRMVDAKVFADSYALGAKNHNAFYENHKENENASFVFVDASDAKNVRVVDEMPSAALELDRQQLASFAMSKIRESQVGGHIKRGAQLGLRIWQEN